jgi:DNA-binding transcriptional LysR family regulator
VKTELELRHLRVFAAVVEAGTRTRAAQALGLSQSTVSETLAALERAVGVELFRRAAKAQALTPSGVVLLAYAQRMSALTSELAGALASASADVKATLTVASVESVGAYVLPSRLAALRERWPAVRVEVTTGSCAEIRDRVAAGACDVGLTLETEDGPAVGELLARGRLLILCGPGHPLAGAVASADDLQGCEFQMCDGSGNYHDALRRMFEAAGTPPPRLQALGTIEGVKRGVRPALPALALRAVVARDAEPSPVVADLLESLRAARVTP